MLCAVLTVACVLAGVADPAPRLPVSPPPAPPRDDYELFLETVLESPRGQRKVWLGKVYNAPYKCAPGASPCPGGTCPVAPAPQGTR